MKLFDYPAVNGLLTDTVMKCWTSEQKVPCLNLGFVTFCFSVSFSKTLNHTQEYKSVPVITGDVACGRPASHPEKCSLSQKCSLSLNATETGIGF
jgi:hypothetical protein